MTAAEGIGRPSDPTTHAGRLERWLEEARAEAERLRAHSILLNQISWRIAEAVGDVPEGADRVEGDPEEQLTRLIAAALAAAPEPRTCRVCSCTDDAACDGGCAWRPDDGRGPCCTGCDPALRNVYVASSWRNPDQPAIVAALRDVGHDVYDFRNPPNGAGFGWEEIHPDWQQWTSAQYVAALEHPRAVEGFASDFDAMQRADTVVLVLPCGRSAHLELGWAVGAGKRTAILLNGDHEPELMVKMVDHIATDLPDLLEWLAE